MKELIFTFIFLALIVLLSATYKDPQLINYLREQMINSGKNTTTSKSLSPTAAITPKNTITINITSQGFSPQILTIRSNVKVIWNNKTNLNLNVVTNNANAVKIGLIKSFTSVSTIFKNSGTYNYYIQTQPEKKETVIVNN